LAHLPQLWVGRNGRMTPSGIYQVVHHRARVAGLPEMHPHQLRHAFATTRLAEGGNENELMLVARWKSRTMIDHHTKATAVEHARASHARLSSADRIWAHVGPVCPAVRTHMTQDRAEVTGGPRPKATESTSSSEDTIRLRGQAVGCLIGRLVAT
jgi:hypothetical protein